MIFFTLKHKNESTIGSIFYYQIPQIWLACITSEQCKWISAQMNYVENLPQLTDWVSYKKRFYFHFLWKWKLVLNPLREKENFFRIQRTWGKPFSVYSNFNPMLVFWLSMRKCYSFLTMSFALFSNFYKMFLPLLLPLDFPFFRCKCARLSIRKSLEEKFYSKIDDILRILIALEFCWSVYRKERKLIVNSNLKFKHDWPHILEGNELMSNIKLF